MALQNNEFKIAEILRKINFFDKYICMRTELTPFSYTRNDIVLLLIFTTLVILKLIYVIKLFGDFAFKVKNSTNSYIYIEANDNHNNGNLRTHSHLDGINSDCRIIDAKNCLFDVFFEVFVIMSIVLDFSIILSIFYFNCCIRSRRELKIRDKSLIVKYIFK